ncbi:MAG TPA: cation:proton antiporter [Parachlamydiaceae bacterium]|nr:cation:proton antiporter [Parachlamydiaceae bacterium]
MEVPIIKEIVIIFALSIGVLLLCHRLKLPAVVGFLVTGILCGPHGMGLVSGLEDVNNLATIGIVLLLFTVGMEFSIKNIVKYKYYFFGGGVLQVFTTLGVTFLVSRYILDCPWNESIFLGFLISLSSTAIVLRALDENGETESPHGRLILGILIFQDIIAVPMMLLVPLLAGTGEEIDSSSFYHFLYGITVLVVMAVSAFYAVPKLLYYVTRTRNRELFLLSVLTVCFAVAWITSSIGLSLSLGAFLAGLIVSESEYSDEAVGNVLPFQEIFTSFFFVSMGMLLDVSFVVEQPFLILALALLVLGVKSLIAGGAALVLGMPLRSAIIGGIALSQVGEFAFVVAHSGTSLGLVTDYGYQLFLSVSLLTMGVTPTIMYLSTFIAAWADKLPIPKRILTGMQYNSEDSSHVKTGHIIICGFGIRGRHIARAAKAADQPYIILEMNPETVKAEKHNGEPIRYGDPSHQSVLVHAGIRTAKTVAVVINDPLASKHIVKLARSLNPEAYIITRTRYFQEVPLMLYAGANDVIPDEFGSSLEIFTRILQKAQIPQDLLYKYVNELRTEGYDALGLHNYSISPPSAFAIDSTAAKIETMNIAEGSSLVGNTVMGSELKKVHGLTVLVIKRQNRTITAIQADTDFQAADSVVVVGSPECLTKAKYLFQAT